MSYLKRSTFRDNTSSVYVDFLLYYKKLRWCIKPTKNCPISYFMEITNIIAKKFYFYCSYVPVSRYILFLSSHWTASRLFRDYKYKKKQLHSIVTVFDVLVLTHVIFHLVQIYLSSYWASVLR